MCTGRGGLTVLFSMDHDLPVPEICSIKIQLCGRIGTEKISTGSQGIRQLYLPVSSTVKSRKNLPVQDLAGSIAEFKVDTGADRIW